MERIQRKQKNFVVLNKNSFHPDLLSLRELFSSPGLWVGCFIFDWEEIVFVKFRGQCLWYILGVTFVDGL